MTKKIIFIFAYLQFTSMVLSQVGIGTDSPDPSALLHLSSTDKGVLFTKIDLNDNRDRVTVPNPANGLVVYNTGTSYGVEGLYFNLGTPEDPNWNAVQGQSNDGSIIEYNSIRVNSTEINFNRLGNSGDWTEVTQLRQSFRASTGSTINVLINGMIELWHGARASFQTDYLVMITPRTLLPNSLTKSSYYRSGVVLTMTNDPGLVAGVFGTNSINFSEQLIAPSEDTYHVQVYVSRTNTPNDANRGWLGRRWSTNVFVSR